MRGIVEYASEESDDSGRLGKMTFILRGMVEEISDELNDVPVEKVAGIFQYISLITGWIGNGEIANLPPELQAYALRFATDESVLKLESA